MEQKDKELLLKDLCGRLPYEVKIHAKYIDTDTNTEVEKVGVLSMIDNDAIVAFTCDDTNCYNYVATHEVKPYLFPLWRMTKKQKEEFDALYWEAREKTCSDFEFKCVYSGIKSDWLNKNHFDHRGLIPMGLAIDATGLNIY